MTQQSNDSKCDMSMTINNSQELKKLYQDFVKVFLKVKFEKIHNTHKGQLISEKILFKECLRQEIPQREWAEFIVGELKQPGKYAQGSAGKRNTKNKRISFKQ